jgi:hypothetical protein
MFIPAKSVQRFSFWTLAGVAEAKFTGEEVFGRFADDPKPFLESRGQLVFEEFANWRNAARDVLRFTKLYGPLEQSARPKGDFRFALRRWDFWQRSFQKQWEHLMPRADVYARIGSYHGSAGDRGWDYDPVIGLKYRAANFLEYLHLSLMACPKERLKKCARSECPNPYFVARHLKQNYCSEECAHWAQKQWKLNWWREHGNKQRDRKQSKTSRVLVKKKFSSRKER